MNESRPGRKLALYIFASVFLLPFVYLASLALLLSAYVHGWAIPGRAFLKVYAAPSNIMAAAPALGSVYSNYFQFCVRVTRADYDPNKEMMLPANGAAGQQQLAVHETLTKLWKQQPRLT